MKNLQSLNESGFQLIENFLDLQGFSIPSLKGNVRFCLANADLKKMADKVSQFVKSIYPNAVLNRSIFFNKDQSKNWSVLWHQDMTICTKNKVDISGFGPWSIKDERHHVKPTLKVLGNMVTARLHFDDATSENGALKVVPGSHLQVHDRETIEEMTQSHYLCEAKAGDLLLMKPLILHSSSSVKNSNSRRILHLEYVYSEMPSDLILHDEEDND